MKFKPVYLYGIVFIALAVFVFVLSEENGNTGVTNSEITQEKMPNDDIHSQMKNPKGTGPSKENVTEEYRQHLKQLQDAVDNNPNDTLKYHSDYYQLHPAAVNSPNDTLKIRELADFLAASHKTDDAINYYKKVLSADPKRKDIRFSLSFIYYTKGDLASAEEQNNKVLEYDPNDEMALYNVGAIAASRGNKEKAREYWNKVLSINPDSETGKLASESLKKL